VFERFTDRARRVLVLAQEEARLLNHSFIGTEHILLGLIHEGEGVAAKALESLGISLTAAREKVGQTIGTAGGAPSGSPPFTPRAKKVLELSLREALQLGHSYIGTEHMLLGIVQEGEGVAAQVLVSLGADLGRVRQQVIQLVSGHQGRRALGASTDPSEWMMGGRGNVPVGCRWSAEAVVSGRGPRNFAAAYDQLVGLARRLGLDDVDESRIHLSSVDTDDGPGLRLSVTHELPREAEEHRGDEPSAGAEPASSTPLAHDDGGSAEASESDEAG
jgi:ATP-dependent Clp protease ATP-binding subunit ClpA